MFLVFLLILHALSIVARKFRILSLIRVLCHFVHGLVQCQLHAFTDMQSADTARREHVETIYSSVESCDLA